MKKRKIILPICLAMTALISCNKADNKPTNPDNNQPTTAVTTIAAEDTSADTPADSKNEEKTEAPTEPAEKNILIQLADNATTVSNNANEYVFVEGNTIIIQKAGTYEIKGKLTDGQIRIEASKKDKVEILFNGADITSQKSAPFYSVSSDKTIIELADGSVNRLTDASKYELPAGEDEPNACLFSKDDLTIKGKGTLIITANYNNGIGCKDDLKISNGIIQVTAANNGIRGNDSITIKNGTISITCSKDAFKVTTEDKEEKGFFLMENGQVNVIAGDDVIQAVTSVTVSGGTITYKADGKKVKCDGTVTIKEECMYEKNDL